MPYNHLSLEERVSIADFIQMGFSLRKIGGILGRHPSTITWELRRNSSTLFGLYSPVSAQRRAQRRVRWKRARPKWDDPRLKEIILHAIEAGWSPEQISGRLRLKYPENPARWVSHQTIYSMVREHRHLQGYLRRGKEKKRKRYGKGLDQCGRLLDSKLILKLPKVFNLCQRIGDWEGDTMKGGKGAVEVMGFVEREIGNFLA